MGVACLVFRGEKFRGWLKNREIRESFLPRKFPAIRYYAPINVNVFIEWHVGDITSKAAFST